MVCQVCKTLDNKVGESAVIVILVLRKYIALIDLVVGAS
jgi:hypothetical protein